MENRGITAAMGILLTGVALWVAVAVAEDGLAWLGVAVLGILGIDAILAAINGRRSLISRIGPLP